VGAFKQSSTRSDAEEHWSENYISLLFQLYMNKTQNSAITLFFISTFSTLVNPERLEALKN
jgi:hypothetical protein